MGCRALRLTGTNVEYVGNWFKYSQGKFLKKDTDKQFTGLGIKVENFKAEKF